MQLKKKLGSVTTLTLILCIYKVHLEIFQREIRGKRHNEVV